MIKTQSFVNGQWVGAASDETFDVTNPATGEVVASVPNMNVTDVRKAIDAAYKAWPGFREMTAAERSNLLKKWHALILENKKELAILMTLECGKVLNESLGEVDYGASFIEWFAEEAKRAYKSSYDPSQGDRLMEKTKTLLEKTIEICPDYHADAYYILGGIAYQNGDKENATRYLKKFMAFESADDFRIPADFAQKRDEVSKVLAETNKKDDFLSKKVPYNPTVVKNVSTAKDEFFPMISPDNELMFFTRRLDRRNLGDLQSHVVEEFTSAKRSSADGLFNEGTPLPTPFNDGSFMNYGASTVSTDNKELIMCACKYEQVQGQNYKNCDLYISHFELVEDEVTQEKKYSWTPLENMGENINTKDGWESQPSLSADGNTLFYTAVRPTTTNQKDDIFISHRNEDGSWGLAVPFDVINTPGKDKSPFLHQDSHTLYFVSEVSDERYGAGGLDIFYIRWMHLQLEHPCCLSIRL